MKSFVALLLTLILIFTCTIGVLAEGTETTTDAAEANVETKTGEGVTMYVTAPHGLMIREAADLNSKALLSVMYSRTVTVLDINGQWAKVRIDLPEENTTVEGYMWADYLKTAPDQIALTTDSTTGAPTGSVIDSADELTSYILYFLYWYYSA